MEPKFAINLYTLRDFCRTPEDIDTTFGKVKKIGYDYVQLSGIGAIEPQNLKDLLDAHSLKACATHTGLEKMLNQTDQVIKEHKIWECTNSAVPSLPADYTGYEGYARFARESIELGKKLLDNGIALAYHNHFWEFEKQGDRIGLDIIYGDSNPDYLFGEIDTYWVQYGGGDPVYWIDRLSGRQRIVHLKDMAIVDRKQVYAEVGEGNLNWPAILNACKAAGVEYYIVEQDDCLRDPFESIAISIRNLKILSQNI